ncbi:zinc finger protein 493 [Galendromus occidentalis]|uniref:Zinc finger protein 493 n=1 Tax=Galendromus occidentalis TaxID=34638 RepID=A0AAJ6QPK0_9ACAR|nr:zinc finger protein 493 [Galendromus occidentalis]
MEQQTQSPRAMICRRVVDSDGVARLVLEPVDKAEVKPQPAESVAEVPQTIEPGPEETKAESSLSKPQKPYISCEKCGKKFFVTDTTYKRTPKERLSLHIITEHNRERLYQCPYDGCFKAYNTVKLLQQHKTVHTNKKRHSCGQCSKQFHRKTHLLAHMRRHSANPEFKPRASRRKLNPYIQFQKKKEAARQEWDDAELPNVNEPVVTEEELEELRRRQAEMVEEEVAKTFPFRADDLEEGYEDEEELDEC